MPTLSGLLAALCLASPVHAVTVPDFAPGQRVYLVPETFAFPTQAVRAATKATAHPVYVVVYEEVIEAHRAGARVRDRGRHRAGVEHLAHGGRHGGGPGARGLRRA
ncbi:MAG: hypothetical protein ABIO70_21575 [Pseudomonadota bacterium]